MRWKATSLTLVFVLLVAVFTAWEIYDHTNREPNLLIQWVGVLIQTHVSPLTLDQRHAGIRATVVGMGASAGLGVLFVLWFRGGRKLRRRHLLLGFVVIALTLIGAPVWKRWIAESRRDPAYLERSRVFRSNYRDLRLLQDLYYFPDDADATPSSPLEGKDVILSLVARGLLASREHRVELRLLFPDAQEASLPSEAEYAALTLESLGKRDFGHLTGYVGPRRPLGTTNWKTPPMPLFADLSRDRALIAFTDFSIRSFSRKDLGLADDAPLIVGDDSPSPLLRLLSDHSGPTPR